MQQFTSLAPVRQRSVPQDIQAARTLANITQRAARLWDDGYSACEFRPGEFFVTSPLRPNETGWASDMYTVFCGESVGYSCTCPCFTAHKTCKHLLAVSAQLEESAWADQQAAREAEYAEGRLAVQHARY